VATWGIGGAKRNWKKVMEGKKPPWRRKEKEDKDRTGGGSTPKINKKNPGSSVGESNFRQHKRRQASRRAGLSPRQAKQHTTRRPRRAGTKRKLILPNRSLLSDLEKQQSALGRNRRANTVRRS